MQEREGMPLWFVEAEIAAGNNDYELGLKRWNNLLPGKENTQALIRRECDVADELAVIVIQCDEIWHTDEHPFCDDPSCGCHYDLELIMEHLERPFDAGLLTSEEYFRVKEGKQL